MTHQQTPAPLALYEYHVEEAHEHLVPADEIESSAEAQAKATHASVHATLAVAAMLARTTAALERLADHFAPRTSWPVEGDDEDEATTP